MSLPRLVYLADEHQVLIPRNLVRFLPQGDIIQSVAILGVNKAILEKKLPEDQVKNLYEHGQYGVGKSRRKKRRRPDVGSPGEFRLLAGQEISTTIEESRDNFDFSEYLSLMSDLHDWIAYGGEALLPYEFSTLDSDEEGEEVPKWDSGFEPFDLMLGGCYQGICTVMGFPGHGKTSIMLTWMEEMRASNAADEIWFYEVEMPLRIMLWKMRPMKRRTKFKKEDVLSSGEFTMKEVYNKVLEDPNPDRVIMIDGPDAMVGGTGEGKRFYLESIYHDLLRLKEKAKMVVVSSQIRRKDRGTISMESVAEAWSKAWFSDMMISIQKQRRTASGIQIRAQVLKNRLGVPDRDIRFSYDYQALSWELDYIPDFEGDDW